MTLYVIGNLGLAAIAVISVMPSCNRNRGTAAKTPSNDNSATQDAVRHDEQTPGPRYDIVIAGRKAKAELAATEDEWRRGLMLRKSLDPDCGMIFVYPDDRPLSFWMKNTFVPLSVAFARSDGTIVKIAQMRPLSTEGHRAPVECRYALEMAQGWFEERGIGPGARIELPQQLLDDAKARFLGKPVPRTTMKD